MRDWIDRTLSRLEWRWSLVTQMVALMTSFSLPAWAAWATDFLDAYAPISWVGAGFAGVFVACLSYALYGMARTRIQKAKFRQRVLDVNAINPLDRAFEGKRIRIVDMSPPIGGIIENKTFVDCELVGPANVLFDLCTFHDNSGQAVDGLLVKHGAQPTNGLGFRNCTFRNCKFYLVTFMVPRQLYENFQLYQWSGVNWLTHIPDEVLPLARAIEDMDAPQRSGVDDTAP